jgi:hypothetical protein
MNTVLLRRWSARALGFLLLTALTACVVPDAEYVGGVYEPSGYAYGSWGPGYYVGPSHGGDRGREERRQAPQRSYRPAPQTRNVPSIPSRPRGH